MLAGGWRVEIPSGKEEFQQVATGGAAKILASRVGSSAAADAAEFRNGFDILSDRHFALSPIRAEI
jgi:hypothetical protein